MYISQMIIADSIWLATALLHRQSKQAPDFAVQEIIEKVLAENLVNGFRPGLQVYASKHCVANKSPNPGRYRMLFETGRGRRRLFCEGDPFHASRQGGKIRPEKNELPTQYQPVVDWYDAVYAKRTHGDAATVGGRVRETTHPVLGEGELGSETAWVSAAGAFVIPENLRRELGIMEGTRLGIHREENRLVLEPVTEGFIRSLRGSAKGGTSLVKARERQHRMEK